MKRAILLSGGIDSVALCFWARPHLAMTVDYGQLSAESEVNAAAEICAALGIPHEIIRADCSAIGAGTMSHSPTVARNLAPTEEWWPFRNQLLVTLAAAPAVALGIEALLLGSVLTDREHRDGTPEFYKLLNSLLALQEGQIQVETPAIEMASAELVRRSGIPLELLAWSHSCHRSNFACGACRGCHKHMTVFNELFSEKFGIAARHRVSR